MTKITLAQIDCEKDKINVTVSKTVSGTPNNWVIRTDINVTCDGRPVPNATITYETNYFGGKTETLTTDAQGNTSTTQRTSQGDRPGDQNVTIIKTGTDGSLEQKTTI